MAQYDGSVKINTKIDSDGFYLGIKKMSASTMQLNHSIKETQNKISIVKKEIKEISKSKEEPQSVKRIKEKLEQTKQEAVALKGEIREFGNSEIKSATVERLKSKLEQTQQEASKLRTYLDDVSKTDVLTEGYEYLLDSLDKAKAKLEQLEQRQDKLSATGVKESSKQWKNLQYDIEQVKREILYTEAEMRDMRISGEAFQSADTTSQYAELEAKLQSLTVKQNQYNTELQETENQEKRLKEDKLAKKQEKLSQLNIKQKQYNAELQEAIAKEKQLKGEKLTKKRDALRKLNDKLLVYNRRLEEAQSKEKKVGGTNGVSRQGNSWSTNLKGLKNASAQLGKLTLGSSASGALSGLGGMINTLTSRVKSLVLSAFVFNVLSKGMRSLQEQTASCLSTNAAYNASLKQIKGNLMTAFYPIYNYVLPAINALMTALEKVSGTLAVFSSKLFGGSLAQNQQGAKSLLQQAAAIKSVGKAAGQAKGNLSDIDEMHILTDNSTDASDGASAAVQDYSFGEIQTNDKLLDWLDRMKEKFEPLTEAIGRMLDAAKPLAAPFMEGFIDGLTGIITSEAAVGIINKIADILEGMDAEDAYNIGKAFGTIAEALVIIGGITGIVTILGGLAGVVTAIGECSIAVGAITGILTFIGGWKIGTGLYELITGETVDMTMWEELDFLFDALFNDSEEFFNGLGWLIHDWKSGFLSIFGIESPTWEEFKEGVSQGFNKFKDAWGENGILGITELAADCIASKLGINADVWAKSKQALSDVVSRYKTAFQNGGIAGIVKQAFQDIQTTITNVLSPVYIGGVFQNLINFVKSKFTNVGSEMGSAVGQSFASGVNNIFRTIESIVNGFISKINGIRLVINKIPGVSLSRIETISLPRLATGTVVPANYGEFQAILGDNKREPEIVSPLSTIEKAVENALGKSGGSNKPVTINLNVILDGKTVYDTVVNYNNREIDRTGINPLFT